CDPAPLHSFPTRRSSDLASDTARALDPRRFGEVGTAAQSLIATLDQGLEFAEGTSSYLDVGRLIRGWAVELVLIAALLPFLATRSEEHTSELQSLAYLVC